MVYFEFVTVHSAQRFLAVVVLIYFEARLFGVFFWDWKILSSKSFCLTDFLRSVLVSQVTEVNMWAVKNKELENPDAYHLGNSAAVVELRPELLSLRFQI